MPRLAYTRPPLHCDSDSHAVVIRDRDGRTVAVLPRREIDRGSAAYREQSGNVQLMCLAPELYERLSACVDALRRSDPEYVLANGLEPIDDYARDAALEDAEALLATAQEGLA